MDSAPSTAVDASGLDFRVTRLESWSPQSLLGPAGARPDEAFSAAPQATRLAHLAVQALIDEVNLTPKPGLVDQRGSGAHTDLSLALMHRSAHALFPCFEAMAQASVDREPGCSLRERLAAIGRDGEQRMFAATGGCNTHKGAIWALGLLVAGAVIHGAPALPVAITCLAGEIARFPDRAAAEAATHGIKARQRYGVNGARGEAQQGFPHVVDIALPQLRAARTQGLEEPQARLQALIAIMAHLDDTCLLHRGGLSMLERVKKGARQVLQEGGPATKDGMLAFKKLDSDLLKMNASPGGSGDLLAATLFLDSLGKNDL
jgi:triphosphoribosyl-dephospho-CoA synthase